MNAASFIAAVTMFVAAMLVWPDRGFADRHYAHHLHFASSDVAPDYYACRLGWWQTLRYGHVRPLWGVRCR